MQWHSTVISTNSNLCGEQHRINGYCHWLCPRRRCETRYPVLNKLHLTTLIALIRAGQATAVTPGASMFFVGVRFGQLLRWSLHAKQCALDQTFGAFPALDVASVSCERCLSTALSTSFTTAPDQGDRSRVGQYWLNRCLGNDSIWPRLCIYALECVREHPNNTASPDACSATLNMEVSRVYST